MADSKLTALSLGTPYPKYVYGTDASDNSKRFVPPVAWHNVMAYGAAGDGSTDDTSAIQAAVDAVLAAGGGTVYFPPCSLLYKVTASINFDNAAEQSIIFRGEGKASWVNGNFADYVFKRDAPDLGKGVKVFEKMFVANSHASGGALRLRYAVGYAIRDCVFEANQCLDLSITQSGTVQGCSFSQNGQNEGSIAAVISEDCHVLNCDISGFDVGIAASQSATNIMGTRFEVNGTAIKMGFDPFAGANFANDFVIMGNMFESNGTCIDLYNGCGYGLLAAMVSQSFPSSTPYERVAVSSTTITDATSGATGTGSITTGGTLTISGVTGGTITAGDYITGTGVPTKTQIYSQLSGTSGGAGTYACNGSAAYGLRVRNSTHDCTFISLAFSGSPYVACISVENTDDFGYNTYISCRPNNAGGLGGASWVMPTQAKSGHFINCGNGLITNGLDAAFTVAGLPTAAEGAYEGMEVNITDSNTATWGATVASGGSNHILARFNGTNWTVVGK